MMCEALLLEMIGSDQNDPETVIRNKYHKHLQKKLREIRNENNSKEKIDEELH